MMINVKGPQGQINVKKLHRQAKLPVRAHEGDAGADLFSDVAVTLHPGEQVMVSTGIAVEIPHGFVGLVHPRSGLAANYGITVVNAPGTIDAAYRGEVKVILRNLNSWGEPVYLDRGSRIAQLVVQKVELPDFVEASDLSETVRSAGGFGSTGI